MKSSASLDPCGAVGELARKRSDFQGALAFSELPCLPGRFPCAGRDYRLLGNRLARPMFLIEVVVSISETAPATPACDFGVAQLGLGLTSNCGP
jgi:hypothetical protein